MKNPKKRKWKEREFEEWFRANPVLPGGERLAVISQESPLRRVADIVALDADGGLVIIEIKNEKTPRSVVGQALEYLSKYDGITVDALADDLLRLDSRPLPTLFADTFTGRDMPAITSSRRVILVAPEFDHHSCHGINFLNRQFKPPVIKFQLLEAERLESGFDTKYVVPLPLVHSGQLVGKFGLTPSWSLVFVFEGGNPQIHWYIGKRKDGVLQFGEGEPVTMRTLRQGSRLLLRESAESLVDFDLKNSVWRSKKTPKSMAKVIGVVDAESSGAGRGKVIFYAKCEGGRWAFRKRQLTEFKLKWEQDIRQAPPWREIVEQVKNRENQSRGNRGM